MYLVKKYKLSCTNKYKNSDINLNLYIDTHINAQKENQNVLLLFCVKEYMLIKTLSSREKKLKNKLKVPLFCEKKKKKLTEQDFSQLKKYLMCSSIKIVFTFLMLKNCYILQN